MTDAPVRLTRLTIQSFKSLEFVDIELGVINVFIGANGSGKSNLLEAVGYLSAAAGGRLDDQALLRRGVRPGPPGAYAMRLREFPAPPPTKIVATLATNNGAIKHGVYRTAGDSPIGDIGDRWMDHESVMDAQDQARYENLRVVDESGELVTLRESRPDFDGESYALQLRAVAAILSDYGIFAPTTPALRGAVTDYTQRSPIGLAGGQLAEAVRELLKPKQGKFGRLELDAILDLLGWVDGITVGAADRDLVAASVPTTRTIIRFADRWMADTNNQLSAYDASEGALYVLFALVLALHPKAPRLFAIENLDQNMHPRLARATVRLFCEQLLVADPPRQALLTTHNPLVLDGLNLRDDRIRLFTVERAADGATRVDRVAVSAEMLQAIDNGLSLSNLWVMGRLGGVPDLF
jgi:hypothetical protein